MNAKLHVPGDIFRELTRHFNQSDDEELAFMTASWDGFEGRVGDCYLVPRTGLELQSPWHLTLGDADQARVIKWAHDREAGLVEAHVHRFAGPSGFSSTDLDGLASFVPHVRWRLRRRPYVALVFGPASFDALIWSDSSAAPQGLGALVVDGNELEPTGETMRYWSPRS